MFDADGSSSSHAKQSLAFLVPFTLTFQLALPTFQLALLAFQLALLAFPLIHVHVPFHETFELSFRVQFVAFEPFQVPYKSPS